MAEKFRFSFSLWPDFIVEISLFTATSNENQGLQKFCTKSQEHLKILKPCVTHYSWINSWQMVSSQTMS